MEDFRLRQLVNDGEKVLTIAKKYGYASIDFQENIGMASFTKKDVRINVYLTKRTVGTCMNHPTKGKTQLFRKNVNSVQNVPIGDEAMNVALQDSTGVI